MGKITVKITNILKIAVLILPVCIASYFAGSILSVNYYTLPHETLRITTVGKFYTELYKLNKVNIFDPKDCKIYDPSIKISGQDFYSGGCFAVDGDTKYYFEVAFTEAGAIEYSDLEIKN